MKFILLIIVHAHGIVLPVQLGPFASRKACEAAEVTVIKGLTGQYDLTCVPITDEKEQPKKKVNKPVEMGDA